MATNNPIQSFNKSTPLTEKPPERGFLQKTWDGAKWAAESTLWGATRPLAWTFNPIGDGLGTGVVSGAKRELEQLIQPDGPLVSQLKESVEQALLKQPTQEFLDLKELIKKSCEAPEALTIEDVQSIYALLKQMLVDENGALLKHLAPDLTSEEMQLFQKIAQLFQNTAENDHLEVEQDHLNLLKREIAGESKQDIQDFDALFNKILNKNQGTLIRIMECLQQALLSDAKQSPSATSTDKKGGILVQAIDLLDAKLSGVLDLLDTRLNDKEVGILSRAAGVLQDKLMAQGGLIDQIDERLARTVTILEDGIDGAKDKLMAQGGFIDQIDEKLTGQAHHLLSNSRKKCIELSQAITQNNKPAIQKSSKELQQLFEQLIAHRAAVFHKNPLSREDQFLLSQLKEQLPSFYSEHSPTQNEMLTLVEPVLSKINLYYRSYEGVAARTATILQEAIDPLLTRVETLPSTMISSVFGAPPTPPIDPPIPSTPREENISNAGNISQFLSSGGSILKKILDKGTQTVSTQVLSSFSSILAFGIQQVLNKMEEAPAFDQPRSILGGIIDTINSARENGNWSDLYQKIVKASQVLKPVKIYVNGFRIPNISMREEVQNAEGIYYDNMGVLQESMNNTPADPVNQNWKILAEDERKKLVDNTTKFLTIKHIYEEVCHLKPDDEQLYVRLLMKSKEKGTEADTELKNLFFEELAKKNINFVTRLYAKILYFFYSDIIRIYTEKASSAYFVEIFNYIERNNSDDFDTLRNQITTNFTRYLTILGGAYQNVSENSNSTGTLNEMLQKELEKKEANLGFEIKDLYSEFAQIVLRKTLGSRILAWLGKKFIVNPEQIIRAIIDKSLGSMRDARGYMYALNSVVHEQLKEIWKLLQADQAKRLSDPTMQTPELSDVKKNELRGLVRNLFEIFNKSKCQTKDELRDLIKGKLLSAKINRAVDDLFIEEIIEKVTNILAITVQSLIKEDQLQKLTYKFASLVNSTFEINVSKEALLQKRAQEEEREIAKLSGQILRLTVNTAVEEKFDFTGKKQETETNRFITDLHQFSTEFFTTMGRDLTALSSMDFNSLEGKNKINKIVEETLAHQSQCYESSFQAKGSKVNSDNKDEIGERHLGIAQQSQPLVQAITQLKQHSNMLENIQITVPHLKQIREIISTISLRLFPPGGPTNDQLTFCENQLAALEKHVKELKQMRNHAALADQIAIQTRIVATILIDLRKMAKTSLFCTAQLQPGSLLEQIANEKKQSLGSTSESASLKNKLTLFKQEILNAFDDVYRPQLLSKLRTIEDTKLAQQVDTALQEFMGICRQAMPQTTPSIDTHRSNYYQAHQQILTAIDHTHLFEPNQNETAIKGIRDSIALAQQHLQALETWEEKHIQQVPYINFSTVDMKGLQDWASGLVCDRIQERLDGFMGFLKREETYRYGLLNHMFLVPYVQASRDGK